MTSMMIRVADMPPQLHRPRDPTTAPATISTPPRPSAALQSGGGCRGKGLVKSINS